MFRPDLLAGKRYLVTGGGSGLGREIAARVLALGADVAICGRRAAVLEETAAQLMQSHGGRVLPVALDIRDYDAVDTALERVWADLGPLDGLVNNAAGNFVCRTEELSRRGFEAISDIVLRGTFYVTQAAGRRWIAERRRGSVVSVIVTWTITGAPYVVASAMSKSGVETMTRSLAVEWGHYGIRLNAIAPGVFPTEGANARLSPQARWTDESAANPMNRVGRMDELQNSVVFLLSDEVEWLTGHTLIVDGGGHLQNGASFTHLRDLSDADWRAMRQTIRETDARDRALRKG
jgi:NAD(P)-dependent dehydrogenase (short-subunit alcohol dehydrogenase family)